MILLFTLLPLAALLFCLYQTWIILPFNRKGKTGVLVAMVLCMVLFYAAMTNAIDSWPMWMATAAYKVGTAAFFVLLYLCIAFILIALLRLTHALPKRFTNHSVKGTAVLAVILIVVFAGGNWNYHIKRRRPIKVETIKRLPRPLTIVMLADMHLGYGIQCSELAKWVDIINAEHPDLILIAGDIIDKSVRPLDDEDMAAEFHRLNAPVYACLGNHEYYADKGYSMGWYAKAGIHLLIDKGISVDGINIIGRDDRSNGGRAAVKDLMNTVDKNKFTILLDHQPYNLDDAANAGVDFQLSGHTHDGQVWPINWIEHGMYEDAHGPLQKHHTCYYVTSGMGIWGGKFRIGTSSEYLVVKLLPHDEH